MRLINVQSLTLGLFTDPVAEPYAILSHTWTDGEVTFQDMQDVSIARTKSGFMKIEMSCRIAIDHGLQYVWVDTCCIDKSSSAELSEAINSMFSWYKNARMCYAFLSDLPAGQITWKELRECRWFTRGWTLQELIAPTNMLFLDEEWKLRGTKEDFARDIEAITSIDQSVLNDSTLLPTISLAKRMSWAAKRQTTRTEDLAYCLMGIFDVNMPMIYGEGSKAFIRLQEEILKKTSDLSLFAWTTKSDVSFRGILAESPAEFVRCDGVILSNDQFRSREEISMTNKGVKINTMLEAMTLEETYVMNLHCFRKDSNGETTPIGIYLNRFLDTYFRRWPQLTSIIGVRRMGLPRPIFLASTAEQNVMRSRDNDEYNSRIYITFVDHLYLCRVHDIKAVPEIYWRTGNDEKFFSLHGHSRFKCFIRFSITSHILHSSPNQGTASEVTMRLILVCDVWSTEKLRMNLYSEADLQPLVVRSGFIDPFRNIELYGPLGDRFSFDLLTSEDQENHIMTIRHQDQRNDYVASADLVMFQYDNTPEGTTHFRISVKFSR